jgi:cold shock CspA family protein
MTTTIEGTFTRWAGRGGSQRLFGFIETSDGGDEQHFVHVSEFRGMRLPEVGDKLAFVSERGPKGLRASGLTYITA